MPTIKALVKDMGVVGIIDNNIYIHAGDLVLRIPADTVYLNLLINFEQREFEKQLMQVHKNSQPK